MKPVSVNVLLVEDNPRDAELLREALAKQRSGTFHLEWVQTLNAAVERLAKRNVDVVLLDLILPDSQGLDTLITMHARSPWVPVVVLTSSDDDEEVALQALHEGAQDYLLKGYVQIYRNLLGRSLRYAVERHRMLKQLRDAEEQEKHVAEDQQHRAEELDKAYRELERTQAMLIQAEKMAAVGQLASGIAHEVKNPLSIILQGINYLEREVLTEREQGAQILQMMREAVKRSDRIVRGLLDFSKPAPLELKASSLTRVLDASLDLVEKQLIVTNIRIVKQLGDALPEARLDDNQMKQVFINLILNAFQAMPQGGTLTINAHAKLLTEVGHHVGTRATDLFRLGETALVCELHDTGMGIPEEAVPKVFDPFFTTKPPGEGTGLGLAITRAIVEAHGGLIEIESRSGRGTMVRVMLPTAKDCARERSHTDHIDQTLAHQADIYAEEIPGS